MRPPAMRWLWCCVFLLAAACATVDDVKSPIVNLVDMRMGQTGLLNQELILTLRVGNPNDFAIPLEGLALEIDVNGRKLADGLSDDTITLPRLGFANIEVTATASTLSIVRELVFLGSEASLDYGISGTAYVGTPFGRRAVPYDQTGKFSILPPERPRRAPKRDRDTTIFKTI